MTKITMLAKDEEFLLALKDGPKKRGRLLSLLGCSIPALRRTYEKLRKYGFVVRERGFYALTDKGKKYVEPLSLSMRPTFRDKKVQALIEKIPTETHQAFFRLLLAGYVAKKYLFDKFSRGWCGFLIGGPQTNFKTNIWQLFCRTVNLLPEEKYLKVVATALPKELWVRRGPGKGEETSVFVGEALSLPFICLDDWRKGDPEVRRAVMRFLDGWAKTRIEKVTVEIRPCPLITTNLDPMSKELDIAEDRIKRSVIVNTRDLGKTPQEYEEIADRIFNEPIPIIATEGLKVVFYDLQEEERDLIRDILYEGVGKREGAVFDSQAVKILVLGWLILTQGKNPKTAIFEVCYDKLLTLESLNLTVEGWRDRFLTRYARYKGKLDPNFEKKRVEVEEKRRERQKLLEQRQKEIKEKKVKARNQRFDFDMEYSQKLSDLRRIIADLKELPGAKWKYKTKKIRDSITKECNDYFDSGKRTPDKLEELKSVIPKRRAAAEPYLRKYKAEQARDEAEERRKQAEKDREKEERENIVKALRDLKHRLYALIDKDSEGRLWRSRTKRLRGNIGGVIKQQKRQSLNHLRDLLAQARDKANLMFEEYREQKEIEKAISSIDPLGALVKAAKWFFTPPKKMDHPGPKIKEKKNVLEEEEDGFWWRPKF